MSCLRRRGWGLVRIDERLRLSTKLVCRGLGSSAATGVDTRYATAGTTVPCAVTGAVTPPIHYSTTFERQQHDLSLTNGYNYSRLGNPTRKLLESTFASLEGGTESMAFSSGMQAATSLLLALPHTHVLLPHDLYHGVFVAVAEIFAPWGTMTFEKIDMSKHDLVEQKMTSLAAAATTASNNNETKRLLLWLETPSNPLCIVTDIEHLCRRGKEIFTAAGRKETDFLSVVDATWCSPYLVHPLALGADFSLHSTTKYVSGHSDVLGGMITAADSPSASALLPSLRTVHQIGGGVLGPQECWMTLRGLRSLPVRMAAHCANALAVARALQQHPLVECVHYPGLENHPQHQLAKKQMRKGGGSEGASMYGGMVSFLVKAAPGQEEEEARKVVMNVHHFRRATSLGGTESLIEHRRPLDGVSPPNLLRMSVGLEDANDLIKDLFQALEAKKR